MKTLLILALAMQVQEPLPNYVDLPPVPEIALESCRVQAENLQNFVGQFGGLVRRSSRFTFDEVGTILGRAVNVTQPFIEDMKYAAHDNNPQACQAMYAQGREALISDVIEPVFGDYAVCIREKSPLDC